MSHDKSPGKNFTDGLIDLIAGSLGGVALVYVGQPLDTVKVKLQTFPNMYRNMFHCIEQTVAKEGIFRGLYAGTVPAVAANVAENSVLFAAYGGCQKLIRFLTNADPNDSLPVLGNAGAGFLAAFFSSFTLCPTELVKCKLQAAREFQLSQGKEVVKISPFQLTRKIIQEEGIKGLFKGLGSTIAREMPGYFVFFGGYELTRELFTVPGCARDTVGPAGTMVAGAVGGIAFWLFIFPADVVKSRLQVTNLKGNLLKLIYEIGKREGVLALYSGLGPTLVRTVPATAVLFLTYESTKIFLHEMIDPPNKKSVEYVKM